MVVSHGSFPAYKRNGGTLMTSRAKPTIMVGHCTSTSVVSIPEHTRLSRPIGVVYNNEHMSYRRGFYHRRAATSAPGSGRIRWFRAVFVVFILLIAARLFVLQVIDRQFYAALAASQHDLNLKLFPKRGEVFVRDRKDPTALYPVAANRDAYLVYADPRVVGDASSTARTVAPLLGLDAAEMFARLSDPEDPYEPLKHAVPDEVVDALRALDLPGLGYVRESVRVYPDPRIGGHLVGFVGSDTAGERRGRYGIEGTLDEDLAGRVGELVGERDIAGRWIPVAKRRFVPATDGADIVLTIDRTVQYVACERLRSAVERHGADGGSVVILEPATGAVLAMCSVPDFNPNAYNEVRDASVFVNPVVMGLYEPGSVMKPVTMAAAIDAGAVNPSTTYLDTGSVALGGFTIKNADNKTYGLQTMTSVLQESINTGAIFVMRSIGKEKFRAALSSFGFGAKTGIELSPEAGGNLGEVGTGGEIYAATAAFGQGITATTLQLASAFGVFANGGILMRPYLVDEIRRSDGTVVGTKSEEVRRVVSERTATLLGGMLTNVVEQGHGKRAGVKGYYVAGKTGTAQIPNPNGPGYLADAHIGSFIGYAPVSKPRFVMAVRINRPRDVQFAESSAAPLFGEIASFLLNYFNVPPERQLK